LAFGRASLPRSVVALCATRQARGRIEALAGGVHMSAGHLSLHREPTKVEVNGVNLTYERLIPRVQKSFLSKDREAMQPHIRALVDRAVTFITCLNAVAPGSTRAPVRSSRIKCINIADACAMQISDLAEWVCSS
jgi:hypothetical protein